MKFKAFFLTITIQKRKLSHNEILRATHSIHYGRSKRASSFLQPSFLINL